MSYVIKKDKAEEIKKKFIGKYIAETLGITRGYMSRLINGKVKCPKVTAYAFTKVIDTDLEIEDLFERV